MIVQLAHVCIETSDLDKTESFYSLLGAKRQFDFKNKQGELVGFYMSFGNNSYIEIIKVSTARKEGNIRHFALEVADVDALYTLLKNNGIEATERELGGDETLMVTSHDPNGNFIEFHQYTEKSFQHHGGVCIVDYNP